MVAPLLLGSFAITLLNYIGISALVALGLVLLTGIGGMTSFGQAAFVGIAAYATAWVTVTHGLSPWLGLLLALAMSGLAGLAIGALTLARRALSLAQHDCLGHLDLFPVRQRRRPRPKLRHGWHPADHDRHRAADLLAGDLLSDLVHGRARHAGERQPARLRQGRAIRSLRGGGVLLASLGVNTFRIRLVTFVLAALLAGLAGWLYAHMNRFVSPAPFDVKPGIDYLLMAMAGGAGHIAGAVAGSALITLLKNWLQDVLPLVTKIPAVRDHRLQCPLDPAAAKRAPRADCLHRKTPAEGYAAAPRRG